MKYLTCLAIAGLLFGNINAQNGETGDYDATVKYNGPSASGTISVAVTSLGKNKAISMKNAISNALFTLLFRGIPGSQYELPMVPNESEKKNDPVIKTLLESGYSTFIIESKVINEDKKKKRADGMKGKWTENHITINCAALRRYLEQNNVIRKFGI